MRHNLLRGVAAAAVLVGTSAYAADLPVYVEPVEPAPVMDVVTYSFTGAWVGVQAGAVFGGELDDLFDDDFDFDDFDDDGEFGDDTTWEAGVAAGFDWQMGNFVFGVLGDVNWVHELGRGAGFSSTYGVELEPGEVEDIAADFGTGTLTELVDFLNDVEVPFDVTPDPIWADDLDLDGVEVTITDPAVGLVDVNIDADAGEVTDTFAVSEELNWYATARARAGFAAGRFMFYGTGGLSYGNVETSWSGTRFLNAEAAGLVYGDLDSDITEGDLSAVYDDPEAMGDVIEGELLTVSADDLAELEEMGCTGTVGGPITCSDSGSEDDDRWGYALGVGTEVLVTQNFSIGAEYLYVNLGSGDDIDMGGDVADVEYGDAESEDFDFHTVKVRGAFRF